MVNMKQLFVSAAIFAGILVAGPALASKLADQTGNADRFGTRSIMSPAKIDARTRPDATVCVEGEECGTGAAPASVDTGSTVKTPEEIYTASCLACHASGAAGAPKTGEKAEWADRIAKGEDVLYTHAIDGFNMMPPKGTCAACSDDEIKAVVDYMVELSK